MCRVPRDDGWERCRYKLKGFSLRKETNGFVCMLVCVCVCVCVLLLLLSCVCVFHQCELDCSTLSPTSDGGCCPAAVLEEEALGGEALRLELPEEEEVTAGRMSGGGGWL